MGGSTWVLLSVFCVVLVASKPHDISLIVHPGKEAGKSQLNFRVGDDERMGFSFVHAMKAHEVLNLQNSSATIFKISGKQEDSTISFLQKRSIRSASVRRLLAEAPKGGAPLVPGESKKKQTDGSLAQSIRAYGKFSASGALMTAPVGDVSVGSVKQWRMVAHESFHKGAVEGWTRKSTADKSEVPADGDVSTCAKYKHEFSDYFLGAFGGAVASKTFKLPPHTMIRIQARIHFLDRWMGELVFMETDGKRKWTKAHEWCSQLFESRCQPSEGASLNTCGDSNFPDTMSVPIDVAFRHVDSKTNANPSTIKIAFGADYSKPGTCTTDDDCNGAKCQNKKCLNTDATWGVDDVRVYVQ